MGGIRKAAVGAWGERSRTSPHLYLPPYHIPRLLFLFYKKIDMNEPQKRMVRTFWGTVGFVAIVWDL